MTLQAHQLTYARGSRTLFSDINFEVSAGEALWLIGANGSGKTSLLRLLAGLASPLFGEVRWNGKNIKNLCEEFHQILAYCGHASGIKDDLSAWENVSINAKIAGRPCKKVDAYHALNQVNLMDKAHLPARVLSQGQRKRVSLAKLFLHPVPQLVILDEPLTALDQDMVQVIQERITTHLQDDGIVIYTTHQPLTLSTTPLKSLDLDVTKL